MHYRDILRTLSFYLWILLIPLALPFCMAVYCEFLAPQGAYPQHPSAIAFLLTLIVTAAVALLFRFFGRKSTGDLFRREALLLVLLVYFLTPMIGALPFFLSGTLANPFDAFFEAVSGVTTTGATVIEAQNYDPVAGEHFPIQRTILAGEKVHYAYFGTIPPVIDDATGYVLLTGLDAVSPALIFWRSFMQWLGGGGVVVLFVAILPALGVGGKILFQTEVTGPSKESLLPRIKETASQLWKIYLSLTVLEVFLLMLTNKSIPLFDAITVSFSTISTGGFTPRNGGIELYESVYTDWVLIAFMIIGSISFSIYFFCMRGKWRRLNDPELKAFLAIILFASALAAWQLYGTPKEPLMIEEEIPGTYNLFESIRYGAFQVVSAQTSTGFATANYDFWPFSVQVLMLVLIFVGGMAGSTAGGLKVIRQQTFFRIMLNKIESLYRPETVRTIRIGQSIIDPTTALTVLCFFMVAAALLILGTFLLVLDNMDPETSLTTIAGMMNNVGFAFRMGAPIESFAFLSDFGKALSALWMIAGRLEYFAVLILFVPAFWKKG